MRFGTVLFIGASAGNLFILGGLLIVSCQGRQENAICSDLFITTSIVISSLLSGLLGTFWFVCHPVYINRIANMDNKQLYFGLSSSIYYTALIFGNFYGMIQ